MKVRLENRLQHERRRHLRHSVSDRRNPQRPLSSIGLRNVPTPHRRGSIRACSQSRRRGRRESASTPILLDGGQRHRIDARRAAVLLHSPPCFPQDVTPVDAVHQRMEASARLPLGRTPESALQLAHFVDGLASAGVIGTGPAGHALARACVGRRAPAGTLRSARVVRRGLVTTTVPSDARCAALAFAVGLYEPRCRDDGCADGPLVFRSSPCPRAAPPTPPRPAARASPDWGAADVAFAVT